MQIDLTGHHVEITPALREYVMSKFQRIERHFDGAANARVILGVEKMAQKAEASIHVRGNDLFANAEAENMYAAIDALADKLDRQIKKYKEKQTDYHRKH
ncbi:MAG TPA: ribosome-associated translation inhibitor RaiA [Gammaproteobacteria bacterium]|nr:ribosome-associated translation inhibitor RaiA [Gammaproteobacteria bacterium]